MIDILVNYLYRAMNSICFKYGDARMRDYVVLFINGKPVQITGANAFLTLTEFLRLEQGLVGTKVVCSEGDCGACSVLIGNPSEDGTSFSYRCIDSCIVFMHQLDGTHVITVEGLTTPTSGTLSVVQNAMVQCHGSQCGYCTPGFVMAMHGLCEEQFSPIRSPSDSNGAIERLSDETLRLGLSGNLCRCTGYLQIIEAGKSVDAADLVRMNELYPPESMLDETRRIKGQSLSISHHDQLVLVPRTLDEALEMKSLHPNACIVSGATDVGVWYNHGRPAAKVLIVLAGVRELSKITDRPDVMIVGAGATWAQLVDEFAVAFPEMVSILIRFGSPQIRYLGTIGGNLVNASPIADSIPFLMAIEATLNLSSIKGTRSVPINDFYLGYKQIDLRTNELLESIECPKLNPNQKLRLYKVSKRQDWTSVPSRLQYC
jgi:xanthine dehydrogenase small subunit